MTCASMGGYMAVVNSAHENTYLRNFLLTNDGKLVLKNLEKKHLRPRIITGVFFIMKIVIFEI